MQVRPTTYSKRAPSRMARSLLSAIIVLAVMPFGPQAPIAAAGPVTGADLRCVTFVDSTLGFAAGASGTIVRTTDGGLTWGVVRSGGTLDLQGISFIDSQRGWAVSKTGVVLATTNGGDTWSEISSDLGGVFFAVEQVFDVEFLSTSYGVAVGGAQDSPPVVWHTYTGGSGDWLTQVTAGSYEPPPELPPTPKLGLGEFYGIDYPSTSRAWAVGHDRYKGANKPVIWSWDDARAGAKWLMQTYTGTGPLYDVSFESSTTGVAVGSGGKIARTVNSGATWTPITGPVSGDLSGVALAGGGTGWAVGAAGAIIKTVDSGSNWSPQTSGSSAYLESVATLSSTRAVAVGRAGTILVTTNGTSWQVASALGGAPVMTGLSSATHPSSDAWYPSLSGAVQWTASGSGIVGYGYVFDQAPATVPSVVTTTAVSAPFTATSSGVWYAHVAAKDDANRWSAPWHLAVRVDAIAPTVTSNANESVPYAGEASVAISGADTGGSGVAAINYRWNGGSIVPVAGATATAVWSVPGAATLEYWSVDGAGNESGHTTKTITIEELPAADTERVSSASRYSTAVEIARTGFDDGSRTWPGVDHVIIASGDDRAAADPLAASGLCWAYDAPLFLVSERSAPAEVVAAIREIALARAGKVTLHVVGGPVSVPDARVSDIISKVGPAQFNPVDRVLSTGGRYELAREIALEVKAEWQRRNGAGTSPDTVLLANGADPAKFFDALALSPIAASNGYPILLVSANEVPSATSSAISSLAPTTKIVGGGPSTVSEAVRKKLGAVRWAGQTRYSTATTIASKAISERGWLSATTVGIAARLPDALTGGSMVGRAGGVLLLTQSDQLSSDTKTWLVQRKAGIGTCYVLGGDVSVRPSVLTAVKAAID